MAASIAAESHGRIGRSRLVGATCHDRLRPSRVKSWPARCGPSRDEIVTKLQPASHFPVLPVRAPQPAGPPWPPGASFAVSLAWSASAGAASVNAFHAPSGRPTHRAGLAGHDASIPRVDGSRKRARRGERLHQRQHLLASPGLPPRRSRELTHFCS